MKQKSLLYIFGLVTILSISLTFNSTSSAQDTTVLPPLKIVQLGDSYSAGNGARSTSGERNYIGPAECYRSPTNWGSQYANSLKDSYSITYINRACSGAVAPNVYNEENKWREMNKWWKPGGNILLPCPSPEYPDEERWVNYGLYCQREIRPQIDAIDSSVDLVLMTLGGNDVEFKKIVASCFATGLRSATTCRDRVERAKSGLDGVANDLYDIFMKLRGKLRNDAKIAFVSYPYLVPNVDYTLTDTFNDPFIGLPLSTFTYPVAKEVRLVGDLGDQYQNAAVLFANSDAGEDFVKFYPNTKALFDAEGEDLPHPYGHLPNPFQDEDRNPDRWLNEFEGAFWHSYEWYHPNQPGHQNWANALSKEGTFGASGGWFSSNADIDIAFVVDTTGSMGGEIAQVREDLSILVDQLAATTDSYRVAVVSYRDFPERTGDPADYPSKVIQTFTDDPGLIQTAIDSLTLGYGGDWEETVFSGIQAAVELPWRPGVTKIMIVIGDAPALSPEPISGLTIEQIIANCIALDPVQVFGADTYDLNYNGALGEIAAGTGGSVESGTAGLTTTISEIIDSAVTQPFAWLGTAYSGKIGEPILFDASGSYDPSGLPITLYEWDFDGDSVFDLETAEATATHVYNEAFNDFVVLRVTGEGGTALASARTVVNTEGYSLQGDEVPCELDENGVSIVINEEGELIQCTADYPPDLDQDGVIETSSSPRYVATTGSDTSNDCTTEAAPCATIVHAIDQTPAGGMVLLAAGTYPTSLSLDKDLHIVGAGMNNTVLDGGNSQSVISIPAGHTIDIRYLTIQNGSAYSGAGINTQSDLTLTQVKISGNNSVDGAGLQISDGNVTITDSIISNNIATDDGGYGGNGGGIFNSGAGTITLNRVEISGNTATNGSGGFHIQGGATVNLTNVTVSGNIAHHAGGITNTAGSTLNIVNSTIANNKLSGPGPYTGGINNYATVNIKNTIISGNDLDQCIPEGSSGVWYSLGYNISSDGSCLFNQVGDQAGIDPKLQPLASNGGYSQTHDLMVDSPAIDAGTDIGCPAIDQRGVTRPQGSVCDIGALEFQDPRFIIPGSEKLFDGWVIESDERSNRGGTKRSDTDYLTVGDNRKNRQICSFLSFSTQEIPSGSTITSASLMLKRMETRGDDPLLSHGDLNVFIGPGDYSNNPALQIQDFQAPSGYPFGLALPNSPVDEWFTLELSQEFLRFIQPRGRVQFKLCFDLDDDNDGIADQVRFYSGDAAPEYQPQLLVKWLGNIFGLPGVTGPGDKNQRPGIYIIK